MSIHALHPPSIAAASLSSCVHCGLKIPRHRVAGGDGFCCEGCRRVHELISSSGLSRYYEIRRGVTSPPPEPREDSFSWAARLLESESARAPGKPVRLLLALQGIHCAACVWLLQEIFRRSPGALDLRINSARGEADLVVDPNRFDLVGYVREANRFGYRFGSAAADRTPRSRGLLVRLGICVAATMNLMILSLSYYFGLSTQDGSLYTLFGRLSFALGTIVFAVGGSLFIGRAWSGIRHRLLSLDLPIAAGVLLVYAGSVHAHVTRGPELAYYDTLASFVTLMILGRWLQERLLERNRLAVLDDGEIEGLTTRRVESGRVRLVASASIEEGHELWIVPGDLVPVECTLLGDEPASLALDWITGEAAPRSFDPGDRISAGAINCGRTTLRLRANERFASSRLLALLRPAPDPTRRAERFGPWRRAGAFYVGAVGVLAAAGFFAWLPHGASRAAAVATSILVVTCPCAIGLATPLAGDLAVGRLRRRGVFVRRNGFFDRALRVRKILFDKTGTLTWGRVELTRASREAVERLAREDRDALYSMALRSNHPMSRCLAASLEKLSDATALDEEGTPVREIFGEGLEWTHDGDTLRLGKGRFACDAEEASGQATWFTRNGKPVVRLHFEETIRPDAADEVRILSDLGYEIHLVSGDAPDRVHRTAAALGIPRERARSESTPEEKAAYVRAIDHDDTLMVGDGLNDAPGLEASLCAATSAVDRPTLPSRVDFFFLGEGVAAVRFALLGARQLAAVTRGNLAVSLTYNAAALALCFSGLMTPVLAAILMPASSIGVVAMTTLRMRREEPAWK